MNHVPDECSDCTSMRVSPFERPRRFERMVPNVTLGEGEDDGAKVTWWSCAVCLCKWQRNEWPSGKQEWVFTGLRKP